MEKENSYDENGRPVKKKKQEIRNKDTVITVDPKIKLKGERDMGEAVEKTAVFTFGRMNPPTVGHEKLIHAVHKVAKDHNAKGHVVTSHSYDNKKNPLPQNKKIKYLQKIHPGVHVHGSSKSSPTVFHQASDFYKQGHKHLVMVVGSDRVKEFQSSLDKYNGKKGPHGHYDFKSIKVVSAGQRDPDAEGVSGMSGTKMRAAAKAKDMKTFKKGLPTSLHKDANDIAKHINEEMEQINEAFEEVVEVLTVAGRRKKAIAMRRQRLKLKRARARVKYRFAGKAQLKRRARRRAVALIKKRVAGKVGERYRSASMGQKAGIDKLVAKRKQIIGRIATRVAPKVRKAEGERLRKARKKANEEFVMFVESAPQSKAMQDALKKISQTFNKTANQQRRIDLEKRRNADPKFREFVKRKAMQKRNPDPKVQAAKRAFRQFGGQNRGANEEMDHLKEYDNIAVDPQAQDSAAENIIQTPQDSDIAKRKGTQPAKYHKGLSKSTKAKRDAQFKKQTKMSSRDPRAYKPAPGDATSKTKPSKYTKMYHDMYGEGVEMELKEFFNFIDRVEEATDPALKARHERERKQLKIKHERERSRSDVRAIRKENIDLAFTGLISEKSQSALAKKAEKSGISVGTLRKVYNRGVAAWRTGHRPGTTPEQWGYARVNAFIAKKKKGNLNHDKDLA